MINTDKELLELAAKAAEIDIMWFDELSEFVANGTTNSVWNPLTDDGDALRLAVKLNMHIQMKLQRFFQIHNVSKMLEQCRRTRQVAFEVSVDDPNIEQALRVYANGTFGTGQQGLEMLFSALRQLGYNVKLQAQDAYVIHDVLNRYAQRMVRTIDKP